MKNLVTYIALVLVVFSNSVSLAADLQVQSGANFDWWADSKEKEARQISVPLKIQGSYNDFFITLLTAYTDTHLDRSGQESRSLGHLLDTKLTTSYEIIGKLPVDIMLGLDYNLPTGKTNLTQRDLALIMDPDLVSINTFGEGLNVNPTISFAKDWGKLVTGIGFGYLWRSNYDFSSEIGITDFNPGDLYNITAEIRYFFSPAMHASLFGRHAWYTKDTVRGQDFYQEGDFSLYGVGLYYSQKKRLDANITFRSIFRDKSKFQIAPGILAAESHNSHGDEWIADFAVQYFLDDKTALRSSLQGRVFTENDYPSDSASFIGQRQKLMIGIGATRTLSPNFEVALDAKGFIKHDEATNYPEFISAREYHGVSVTALLTGRF